MGLSDRDYMREPVNKPEPGPPRTRLRKAGNRPPLFQRLRFWLWSLKNRK